MPKEITLPEIAENVEEGTIISVLVSAGDTIAADQSILEVETDKASVEVPAPFGGKITEVLVEEGAEVRVGQALMRVESAEGAEEEADSDTGSASDSGGESEGKRSRHETTAKSGDEAGDSPRDEAERSSERNAPAAEKRSARSHDEERRPRGRENVPASPGTRRYARELGVRIGRVEGSGPGGRISKEDVTAHARELIAGGGQRRSADAEGGAGGRREKMTRVRQLTAERTLHAWQTIPHVTHFDEAELTELNRYLQIATEKLSKKGVKLTLTALIAKLVSHGLRVFPRFNASVDMESKEIVYHDKIGLSIAVDTDRGLLVPVLRDPDKKSVASIAAELAELAQATRDGSIAAEQMQGGTFAISNLGGIGGVGFTPVIIEPQVAILAVAQAATRPVHDGHGFSAREIMPLGLSYDHRAIDGADAARFLRWLKTAIEDPFAALMEGGS